MSDAAFLAWFFVVFVLCIVVQLWVLYRANRRLVRQINKIPVAPVRTCASCTAVIEPTGSPPVEVQEHVTALVGRGPIPVRFYICQTCAALPEGATA